MKIGLNCLCVKDKGKNNSKGMKGKASWSSCTATSERVERVGREAAREWSSSEQSEAFPKSGATYSSGANAPAGSAMRAGPSSDVFSRIRFRRKRCLL